MPELSFPPDGDRNRAVELNAFAWTWFSLSTVIVVARIYSRLVLTRNFWYDDFLIVLTWVTSYLSPQRMGDSFDFTQALTLASSVLWTILGQLGGCRHLYYLEMDPVRAIKASQINWITQPVTIYALATGKISVAFMILRILGKSKWRKAFLVYGAIMGSFIICTVAIVLTFTQCRPVRALWTAKLMNTRKATCWPPHIQTSYSVFAGSRSFQYSELMTMWSKLTRLRLQGWLAFIDLALALLPITIMWKLQLGLKKKVGISVVLGLGVL